MKHLIPINEFVEIKDYKEWSIDFNWKFYKNLDKYFQSFEDKDKRSNRIYFDLPIDPSKIEISIPQEIKDFLRWFGYPIKDARLGICTDKDGRDIRIGRLLMKLKKLELLDIYQKSRDNTLNRIDNLKVVICRHPYDILGMSTNRGWTTCLNIHDSVYNGDHIDGLISLLKRGCLMAYLIRKEDRNINRPLSRILIDSYWDEDYLRCDDKIYGTPISEFKKFVEKWCGDYNSK